MPRRAAWSVGLAVAALVLAGCVSITVARVPARLLDGASGWFEDPARSDASPESSGFGTAKSQRIAYRDEAKDGRGYAGALTVITLRTLISPSDESLREDLRDQVEDVAGRNGIRLDQQVATGSRALANRATSLHFLFNGTVTRSDGLFGEDAKVKVLGEVFTCRREKSSVVAVGIAQVTRTRSIGGVPIPSDRDATTWTEIVADPSGTIEGQRGGDGLVFNVVCS